jgi:hypothetical protein
MTIAHIAHIARRTFLRNAADPDLQNFWIAQAKALQADLTELSRASRTPRTEHGKPQHPARPAIDAR